MRLPSAKTQFRISIALFITGLALSGITAFPLVHELRFVTRLAGISSSGAAQDHGGVAHWIVTVKNGLETTYSQYPWIAYGTDWLAFGHIVIAMFFMGPLIDPSSSRMVLRTGIVACCSVIPLALICGPIRGIPVYWRLIDCSFGVFGIMPLIYCLRLLPQIEAGEVPAIARGIS